MFKLWITIIKTEVINAIIGIMKNEVLEGEVLEDGFANARKHKRDNVKSSEYSKPTYRQEQFAKNYMSGDTMGNATKSAAKAGYSIDTAHVQGSVLLKNPKVLAILNKNIEAAEQVVVGIMSDTTESGATRLAAAKELMDRTVGKAIQRSENVNINISVESMLEQSKD